MAEISDRVEKINISDNASANLLLRSKAGIEMLSKVCDVIDETIDSFELNDSFLRTNADLIEWNKDGSMLAVAASSVVTVRSGKDGAVLFTLNAPAKAISFSPLGSFILTWQNYSKPKEGESKPNGNLVIWDARTGQEIRRLVQKQLRSGQWPSFQWSSDEEIAIYSTVENIQVYRGRTGDEPPLVSVPVPRISAYSIAPGPAPYSIATFVPEIKGKPAKVTIHRCSALVSDGPFTLQISAGRSSFQAQEINFKWSPDGSVLLGVVSTEVDATGQSYYGSSSLFLIHSDGSFDCSISPPKDGAVHDVQWAPKGLSFAVCAGSMPTQTALYNTKGEQKFIFGTAPRNTLIWSPHARFLCIAGFGNLSGDMDFWDTKKCKLLGSACSSCAVKFGWSPDSRMFMTATCAPRMNVDNGVRIFKYNGIGPVYSREVDTLYDVRWQPVPEGTYPDRPGSPDTKGPESVKIVQQQVIRAPKAPAYRPPGARGGGNLAAMMRAERENDAVGPRRVSHGPSNAAPRGPPKTEQQKKSEKLKKKLKADEDARLIELERLMNSTDQDFEPIVQHQKVKPTKNIEAKNTPLSAIDNEKRKKQLSKKLRQLELLKEKRDLGEKLDSNQQSLLKREAELQQELARLGT